MMNLSVQQVIDKISEETGREKIEIQTLINTKLDQLSGLISEEGAAYIVANDLGIPLTNQPQKLAIKDLKPALSNVEIFGKVMKTYELREFTKNDGVGKVASFLMGDESGVIRVTLWNTKTDIFPTLKEDQIVHITNAYVRENNNRNELHLSDRADIVIDAETKIGDVPKGPSRDRKTLAGIAENDNLEVVGYVVQVSDPVYYEVCPTCNKRIRDVAGKFTCPEHGDMTPAFNYLINFVIDDSTDNVRVVCFKNQVQNLLKKTNEEILNYREDKSTFGPVKDEILGSIIKVVGRVQKNSMFDRLEIICQLVFEADPAEELAHLEKKPVKKDEKTKVEEKVEEVVPKAKVNTAKVVESTPEVVVKKVDSKPEVKVEVTEDEFMQDTYSAPVSKPSADYSDEDESISLDDL